MERFEFQFSTLTTAPPTGSQIRLNNASMALVTLMWVRDTTTPGEDVFQFLARLPVGSSLYLQDYNDHSLYAAFRSTGNGVDRGGYVELPVSYVATGSPLVGQKILLAVFGPQEATPAPPYVSHAYATVAELKPKVLQGGQTADTYQTAEMQRCLDSASAEIDWWVPVNADYPAPDPTTLEGQLIKQVCLARAVELYREAWSGYVVTTASSRS